MSLSFRFCCETIVHISTDKNKWQKIKVRKLSIKRRSNMTVQVFCDNNRMCRKNIKLCIKKSYIYIYIERERERERESRQGEVRWDEIGKIYCII